MRIAFISPFLYKYKRGVEGFTVNLANILAKKGCAITSITWDWPSKFNLNFEGDISVVKVPYSRYYQKYLASIFYLLYFLKHRIDIINVFFTWHGEDLPLYALRLLKDQRFNIILPNPLSQISHRIRGYKRFNLHKMADNIVARSNSCKDEAGRIFKREVKFIPNGVAIDFFRPDSMTKRFFKEQNGVDSSKYIFLTVSAFERRKGIKEFIEAINPQGKLKGKMQYIIVGEAVDISYYNEVKNYISEKGLADIVKIFNPVEDILSFYQAADCFVLLSSGEGCPNSLLEAASCGLPLLVANEPPFDEYVNDRIGLFADKDNRKEVSEKIELLLDSRELGAEMGERARNYVADNFNWDKIGRRYYELFNLRQI